MKGNRTAGRFSALLTIIIWGTTFISTKILLADFPPVQILCFRFAMGLLALLIVYPRRLKGTNRHQELTFAAAGLCGICLYYLLENSALTYTMASNVGVIISVAPFSRLFCADKENQQLWLPHHSHHPAGVLLRHPVYASDTVPVITVVTSVAILHEKITALAAVGTVLTLAGLLLSESKLFLRKEAKQNGLAK